MSIDVGGFPYGKRVIYDISLSNSSTFRVDMLSISLKRDVLHNALIQLNTSSAAESLFLYANGNTTDTNYYSQYIQMSSTAVSGSRFNLPLCGGTDTGSGTLITAKFMISPNGLFQWVTNTITNMGSTVVKEFFCGNSTVSFNDVTSLSFLTKTNPIPFGSRFILYREF